MDAISQLGTTIGSFLSGGGGKLLGVAGLGDQFITNWLNQRKVNDYINQQLKYQKNPKLAQNEITGMTQPLDQNLVASVTNQVQGNLGAQGLAESPNIMASVMGQALAPYQLQEQQQATQLWQAIHGQPPPFPQPANMTPLWSMLLRGNQSKPSSDFSGPGDFLNVLFPGGSGQSSQDGSNMNINDLSGWGLNDVGLVA